MKAHQNPASAPEANPLLKDPLLREASNALKAKHKEINRYTYFSIPIAVCSVGALFINAWLCAAILAFSICYLLFFLKPKRKEFSHLFNHYHMLIGGGKQLENVTHEMKAGVSAEDIRAARLIPCGENDKFLMRREHVTGLCKNMPVELCDASLVYRYKSGRSRRGYCVTGIWAKLQLPASTGCDWRFVERSVLNELARRSYFGSFPDLERTPLDVDWFDKKYYFYRPKGSTEQPDALFLKQLKLLQEYTPGLLCVSVKDDLLQVFVCGRVMARNIPFGSGIALEDIMARPFPELDYLVRMGHILSKQEKEVLVPELPAGAAPEETASAEAQPAQE